MRVGHEEVDINNEDETFGWGHEKKRMIIRSVGSMIIESNR